MIELPIKDFNKLVAPLHLVEINNLFARAVVEKKIAGKAYVDSLPNPKTFYVVHPYGMSLLFGDWRNKEFNREFLRYSLNVDNQRNDIEWMQAWPPVWDNVLHELFAEDIGILTNELTHKPGAIEVYTRVNFKFNQQIFNKLRYLKLPDECVVKKVDEAIFSEMKGHVIPSKFWNTPHDFLNQGSGFSVFYQNELAATAFSAFVFENQLEIGIETIQAFQGKGLAQFACMALIEECIERSLEPVWACRFENTASYKLALKLGFEVTVTLPFYKLPI